MKQIEGDSSMELVNAKLYEEDIKKKMWEIWYDEKYQYYFGGEWRRDFSLADRDNSPREHSFAVLNDFGELIGFIAYSIDLELRIAQRFGAINFTSDKFTFGKALMQAIEDCFMKFGMEVVEWCVVCGNPIERSYDRMCERFGGNIVGIKHRRAKDMAGNPCNFKMYEILREDFFRTTKNRKQKITKGV